MKQQSITDLPPSPGDERHTRMVKYGIAMSIRVVCIVLMLFLHGWWLILPAIGAIVLPYFAVVVGNVGTSTPKRHEQPTQIEVYRPAPGSEEPRS